MKIVKILFALTAAVILLVAGISFWLYRSVTAAHAHDKSNQFITIEKGSTPPAIIDKLAAEGIITSPFALKAYLRTLGDTGNLQAGEYQFSSPITPLQVLKELEKGETQTIKLTIPEGFTRFDVAKRIVEKFGNPPATAGGTDNPTFTEQQVLLMMEDTSLVADIAPEAKNLEGYMYPSTYSFPRNTKPETIVPQLVQQFKKVWKPEWTNAAKTIGRTPHEIVTIASLIETESGVESERPTVASVIYNRLSKSIPLGIDQTVVYIAKMQNRWEGTINRSDLDADSPYNTRKYGGLPPGPISSVSESAIAAALNPAKTDYIYYVRNVDANDGSHWFYSSAAEFERGKAEYQRWLEKERQEKRANEANAPQ
ncbi:MAG: endolytic transglycosylase MltG [Acidobacteria bacterium]|nr:MAG: endolytic transglycosylase MltG [Acidobacteriota bacterium]